MKHLFYGLKGSGKIEQTAQKMLTQLFGNNVILTTQFEFLSIDDKVSVEPEYYYTDRFKFFDFWYNPQQNWLPQLAFAISDYYHELSGTPGDKRTTASKLLQSLSDRKTSEQTDRTSNVEEAAEEAKTEA